MNLVSRGEVQCMNHQAAHPVPDLDFSHSVRGQQSTAEEVTRSHSLFTCCHLTKHTEVSAADQQTTEQLHSPAHHPHSVP